MQVVAHGKCKEPNSLGMVLSPVYLGFDFGQLLSLVFLNFHFGQLFPAHVGGSPGWARVGCSHLRKLT